MKTRMRFRPVLFMLLFTLFFTCAGVASTTVKVMTYNVDEGTDFSAIVNALTNGGDFTQAVKDTVTEVLNSRPDIRMQLIAQKIASAQPDVVGLQEAALWTAPSIPGGTLDLLQMVLSALQGTYIPIETVDEFHIALTLSDGTVSFTDRDVILVRSDLFSAITSHGQGHYSALVPLPSPYGAITRGWGSVDVTMNDTTFRFITTHLEDGTNTTSPLFAIVQALQEIELVSLAPVFSPVIIGGDFNTVANNASSLTHLTYLFMLGNGFTDAWTAAKTQGTGATCCQEDLTIQRSELRQRIDQVFTRNHVTVVKSQLVGDAIVPNVVGDVGYWPSDHAAVQSQLQVGSVP